VFFLFLDGFCFVLYETVHILKRFAQTVRLESHEKSLSYSKFLMPHFLAEPSSKSGNRCKATLYTLYFGAAFELIKNLPH
jgi:hypothetical protein